MVSVHTAKRTTRRTMPRRSEYQSENRMVAKHSSYARTLLMVLALICTSFLVYGLLVTYSQKAEPVAPGIMSDVIVEYESAQDYGQ